MKKHKRLTELSLQKQQEAWQWRREAPYKGATAELNYRMANRLETEAQDILVIPDLPETHMGEVVKPHLNGVHRHGWIRDTLADGNLVAEEASVTRTDLLCQENTDISALAVDAADSIKADNSLEKMLAHQLALAHEMAMKLGNAAMGEVTKMKSRTTYGNGLQPGAASELQRLVNSTSRLMTTFQQGLLTIQRIRTGGNQTVTVQHVNVSAGGQAVIGNVRSGGIHGAGEEQT